MTNATEPTDPVRILFLEAAIEGRFDDFPEIIRASREAGYSDETILTARAEAKEQYSKLPKSALKRETR